MIVEERASRPSLFYLGLRTDAGLIRAAKEMLSTWSGSESRRDAESINHGFLDWLDRRRDAQRPFFAFLNYFDAHTPYRLPAERRRASAACPRRSMN